jgi:hypothetical protein
VATPKPCKQAGCDLPKDLPSHFCYWHRVDRLPIDEQIEYAMARRKKMLETHEVRATAPAAQWPAGRRFCSGCQFMVPLWYTQGSRCRACASHASYSSHLANTYRISYADYLTMLKYKDYRCYICRRRPLKKRLAVDHDHETNEVRGLLCSGERSCNHDILGNIKDIGMAQRIVTYLQNPPYRAMRTGQAMPVEVSSAGPNGTTLVKTAEVPGMVELMQQAAEEALVRRAKAAKRGHYSDGDFWRFPKDHEGPFDIFHAVPDKLDPKVWEIRLELAREKQAKIDAQRGDS